MTDRAVTHAEIPRAYPPSAEFTAQANATAESYRDAERDRLAFWAEQAGRLSWAAAFTDVLDWSGAPLAKWFVGGQLNVAVNCVDRHVEAGAGDRVAIHWEGEPVGDARSITYAELKGAVCKAANALTSLGLTPATGWRSTCRWSPRRSWRCWPVPDWASCTRWCSPASPPRR
jgi:acetyl-CoA synthetase